MRTKKPIFLDAMISRADLSEVNDKSAESTKIAGISLNELGPNSYLVPALRKPDFQRETNQWTEDQVLIFLKSFLDNELVPAVIFWRSPDRIFVIDGAHRVSALLAWVNDDYGDGAKSQSFFGSNISKDQKNAADRLRKLVNKEIGNYSSFSAWMKMPDITQLTPEQQSRVSNARIRSIDLQWVEGNAEKAETSFFKINKQGTALDPTEEKLLRNRRAAISIASRSIIRAGAGHKYWSKFSPENIFEIEEISKETYSLLFSPELETPIKTLNLPHGGHTSPIAAYDLLMDVLTYAMPKTAGDDATSSLYLVDVDGVHTITALRRLKKVLCRITGNQIGSLGLHPAVYFYTPGGRHWDVMFFAIVKIFGKAMENGDSEFFKSFVKNRVRLEKILIEHKALLGQINIAIRSRIRVDRWAEFLENIARGKSLAGSVEPADILKELDISGTFLSASFDNAGSDISEETKSEAFFRQAFLSAHVCPLCGGLLLPEQSASYDHVHPKSKGGSGNIENVQITHPYCNSLKGNTIASI
jgi:hypothetical protein